MRAFFVLLTSVLLVVGCNKPSEKVLGHAPDGKPVAISSLRADHTQTNVVLEGVMIEKCPTAGCWFRLRDGSGVIKVDTKSAGFVVVDVPLETHLTVAGNVLADGSEVQIEATGIRY